jgi:hypothetical protein
MADGMANQCFVHSGEQSPSEINNHFWQKSRQVYRGFNASGLIFVLLDLLCSVF